MITWTSSLLRWLGATSHSDFLARSSFCRHLSETLKDGSKKIDASVGQSLAHRWSTRSFAAQPHLDRIEDG